MDNMDVVLAVIDYYSQKGIPLNNELLPYILALIKRFIGFGSRIVFLRMDDTIISVDLDNIINVLAIHGYIQHNGKYLRLTEKGKYLVNNIMLDEKLYLLLELISNLSEVSVKNMAIWLEDVKKNRSDLDSYVVERLLSTFKEKLDRSILL